MKVTVRDVLRPDDVIQDWPYAPHLGLPFPGDELILPRQSYGPKDKHAYVSRYRWDLVAGSVAMLVNFD